jgi:hypothetical protein
MPAAKPKKTHLPHNLMHRQIGRQHLQQHHHNSGNSHQYETNPIHPACWSGSGLLDLKHNNAESPAMV